MNQSIRCLIGFVVLAVFLMGACQSETPALLPVTGSNNKSALPAQVSLAQKKVLDYVLDSRLQAIPAHEDWELDDIQNENEYHFRSGDWLMVIWAGEEQHQRVVLVNPSEHLSWTGYLTSDGRVVDTNLGR